MAHALSGPIAAAGRRGRVYVLTTRHADVVKIGRTSGCPHRRAAVLSRLPGYRGFAPLQAVWWIQVSDPKAVERLAHRMLRRRRIWLRVGCRELFRADVAQARRTIETAVVSLRPRPPWWRRAWREVTRIGRAAVARLRLLSSKR